ncbi:prolyl oligopeptidase family serine peptidase [Gordonia sp. PKS22-38]|uniref:Prolyl oligopeptidase family serine peptidase n=1 Tax=Gordonia prachuapensis TaxID=3115651 RepID=A0ABU7MUD8_9ACTN|nr:prolyl oligopeptidase family serine peptidase [Gordonia sp. PKS22-38]
MSRRLRLIATAILTTLSTAVAVVVAQPSAAADPTSTPPPNWSGMDVRDYSGPVPAQAGTLIEQVPLAADLSIPGAARAYRIHYATPDQHGRQASSTGAIFLPAGTPPPGGWPVLAWAHGTTGLGDDCTPSAQPRSDRDSAYLSHWLGEGYAIVSTDYVGLGTPGLMSYLNGDSEAHSIVDSVKAARQTGLPLSNRWAIVGQSQGAGAALNGAHQATALSRGSGLDYRGVVATGTPANIEQVIALGGPDFPPVTLPAGLNTYAAYILAGFIEARPDLGVRSALTPRGAELVAAARTLCYAEMADLMTGVDLRTLFRRPLAGIPGVREGLADYMGTPYSGYDRPIFLGQGLLDTDVPAPSALSLYAQMTAAGQPVELHVYPAEDHSGTVLASIRDSTPFLQRIMR